MEVPSPERMSASDPLEDLLQLFRSRFSEAFAHKSSLSDTRLRHPSNVGAGTFLNGNYIKYEPRGPGGIPGHMILLKRPELAPLRPQTDSTTEESVGEADESVETSETAVDSRSLPAGVLVTALIPTGFGQQGDIAAQTLTADRINSTNRFIVSFFHDGRETHFAVDDGGIMPLPIDSSGNEVIDLDAEIRDLNEAMKEIELEQLGAELDEITRQRALASDWLDGLVELNTSAFV